MSASVPILFAIAASALLLSAVASRIALSGLSRRGVLDQPNARSSHRAPVPRGGGVGFMAVILAGLLLARLVDESSIGLGVLAGALAVCVVSFIDDLRPLPAALRLLIHAAAIAAGLASLPADPILADGLPLWLDRVLLGLAWLWFLNLFNFMDGIDGIAASEAGIICLGLAVLALARPALGLSGVEAAIVGGAALGFLVVNWSPARLFMGDIGSCGLGYLLGWLLIDAASRGLLAPALILPLVFVADASTTLVLRLVHGRPLGTAHRDHAYQRAVDRGLSHATVTLIVIAAGLVLIGLAVIAMSTPVPMLAVALLLCGGLLAWLRRAQRGPGKSGQSSR